MLKGGKGEGASNGLNGNATKGSDKGIWQKGGLSYGPNKADGSKEDGSIKLRASPLTSAARQVLVQARTTGTVRVLAKGRIR